MFHEFLVYRIYCTSFCLKSYSDEYRLCWNIDYDTELSDQDYSIMSIKNESKRVVHNQVVMIHIGMMPSEAGIGGDRRLLPGC